MTSQEAGQQQQERTSTIWKQRRTRWAKWKAMQKDFSLPVCMVCNKRFQPEDVAQTACSSFCVRRFVIRESARRAKQQGRK